jgi:hypothetical protein
LEKVAILVVLRMILHHVHHFIFTGTIVVFPLFFIFCLSVINSFFGILSLPVPIASKILEFYCS